MIDDATEMMAKGLDISNSELGQLLNPGNLKTEFADAEYWSGLMKALNEREGITYDENGNELKDKTPKVDEDKKEMALNT
jgi:hypothetical protein